jgi:hypothetical protein
VATTGAQSESDKNGKYRERLAVRSVKRTMRELDGQNEIMN